jgi:limonene-1,2-epoxide hydrolase
MEADMTEARQVVQEFCDLMVKRDAEALRPFLADDAVYQNTGMVAASGVDIQNLAAQFSMFPDSYEYTTINVVADGNIVMNERLDHVKGPSGVVHALPVMGTFVVSEGKIVRWTDYWDTGLMGKMMAGEDTKALVPSY